MLSHDELKSKNALLVAKRKDFHVFIQFTFEYCHFYYSPDDNDDNILATTIFFNGILTKNIIIYSVLTKIIN